MHTAITPESYPDFAHAPPWHLSPDDAARDPTLRELLRLQQLEDGGSAPDTDGPHEHIQRLLPHAVTPIRALADTLLAQALAEDPPPDVPEPTPLLPPMHAAAFASRASPGVPTSMPAAKLHPEYHGPNGWRAAGLKEIRRAEELFGIDSCP